MIRKYRDVSIVDFGGRLLTVACDSCGGVGMLEGDTVKADGFTVGYRTAFVALAETLSIGAEPIMIIDTLSVSLGDYGKSIVKGVRAAAEGAGLDPSKAVTGSSEENFIPLSTGIGITVIGSMENTTFTPEPNEACYDAFLLGIPLMGDAVMEHKDQILTLSVIRSTAGRYGVIDILPAGSRGVLYEAKEMAKTLKMDFNEITSDPDLIRRSAGPATCAVIAAKKGTDFSDITIPMIKIGEFTR